MDSNSKAAHHQSKLADTLPRTTTRGTPQRAATREGERAMATKGMKWAWAIGVPGAALTSLTLIYGGLSAFFETRSAHDADVTAWRTEHVAEVVERRKIDEALKDQIAVSYDTLHTKIGDVRKTADETHLDVAQLVCVVVKKGKPLGKRCTLPNGQTVDDTTP